MTTAFKDKNKKRHLILTFQYDTNRIKSLNFSYLNTQWSTERVIPIVRYEYLTEEEYHNKIRSHIALNEGILEKKRCVPIVK